MTNPWRRRLRCSARRGGVDAAPARRLLRRPAPPLGAARRTICPGGHSFSMTTYLGSEASATMLRSKVTRRPPRLTARASKWASVICLDPITAASSISSQSASDTSSGQNSCPGRVRNCRNTPMASAGVPALGKARLFDETRTKPDSVIGQVAHDPRPLPANHAVAERWWTWLGHVRATITFTSSRAAVTALRGRRQPSTA